MLKENIEAVVDVLRFNFFTQASAVGGFEGAVAAVNGVTYKPQLMQE